VRVASPERPGQRTPAVGVPSSAGRCPGPCARGSAATGRRRDQPRPSDPTRGPRRLFAQRVGRRRRWPCLPEACRLRNDSVPEVVAFNAAIAAASQNELMR